MSKTAETAALAASPAPMPGSRALTAPEFEGMADKADIAKVQERLGTRQHRHHQAL